MMVYYYFMESGIKFGDIVEYIGPRHIDGTFFVVTDWCKVGLFVIQQIYPLHKAPDNVYALPASLRKVSPGKYTQLMLEQ